MSTIKALGTSKIKALGLDNGGGETPYLTIQILHYPKNFNDYIQVEISTNYNPKSTEFIRVVVFEAKSNQRNVGNDKVIIDKYYEIKANNFIINIPFNLLAQNKAIKNQDIDSILCYLGVSGPKRGAKYSNIFEVNISDNPQVENQSLISTVRKPFTYLSDEQKAIFMSAVLVESSNGRKALWDIAYIYLNLVQNNKNFEVIMNRSSAYSGRSTNYMYKCHYYYLTKGKSINKYGDEVGSFANRWNSNLKVRDYVDNGEYLSKYNDKQNGSDLNGCIEFMLTKIFTAKPISRYNNWHGQGNTMDMNINEGKYSRPWYTARQYYWLQKTKKADKIYVKRLFDFEHTSYIYDTDRIEKYFSLNPNKLPAPHEIIPIPHYLPDGTPCHKVELPDPNNPGKKKIHTYEVELNEYGGIKKVFPTEI